MAEREILSNRWRHIMIYFTCTFVSVFVFLEFFFTLFFFTTIAPTDLLYYFTPAPFFLGESLESFLLTFVLFLVMFVVLRTKVYVKSNRGLKFNSRNSVALLPFYLITLPSLGFYIATIPLELSNILIYVIFILLFESFVEHIQVSDYRRASKIIKEEPEKKKRFVFCPVCASKELRVHDECTNCGAPLGKVGRFDDIKPNEKTCPGCDEKIPVHLEECPECGEIFERKKKRIKKAEIRRKKKLKRRVEKKFKEMKKRWSMLRKSDVDLNELKKAIRRAKRAKKKKDYQDALKYIDKSLHIAEELLSKKTEKEPERTEEPKETVCPDCGGMIPEGSDRCPVCIKYLGEKTPVPEEEDDEGIDEELEKLEKEVKRAFGEEIDECPICAADITPGAKKCSECGEPLEDEEEEKEAQECPICAADITPGEKNCPECGERLKGS